MIAMFMAAALLAQAKEAPAIPDDVKLLMETIEKIQEPIEDFRCEYEGSFRAMGPVAKAFKVDDGGAYDTFSGTHIQNRAGDVRDESLHHLATGMMTRESFAARKQEGHVEEFNRPAEVDRPSNGPVGYMVHKSPKDISFANKIGSFNQLLILEELKRTIADPTTYRCSVIDGEVDSRPVKVVVVGLEGVKDSLLCRYYVDLSRGGHVIRCTSYFTGKKVGGQDDVKLSAFRVGGKEVWMPVSVERVGFVALKDNRPYLTNKPTSRETIAVAAGTMVFNAHPGRETFTVDYKVGPPTSDHLRRLTAESGQRKIAPTPTKAEAEATLHEKLAKAQAQKSELVAVTSEGVNWAKWLPLVGVVAVGTSLFALWRQRRRS